MVGARLPGRTFLAAAFIAVAAVFPSALFATDASRFDATAVSIPNAIRLNGALLLAIVGGGLAACALGAVVYDISRWFGGL